MSPFQANGRIPMVRQMRGKEILRVQLLAQLMERKIDQRSVADRLGIRVRQVKRLKRTHVESGTAGLTSKRRGKPSNRRLRDGVLTDAMALIGTHYADFGPTFAAEKLAERHAIVLPVETVRKNMIAAGYWKARRGASVRARTRCVTSAHGEVS